MLLLEFTFPAGRYHATPWGRNVNEGVVEWPPSPYRLARALVDVCRRRRPEWTDARLVALLRPLAVAPMFQLSPATESHTRSFLSSNMKDPAAKQRVLDAFVAIDRGKRVLAGIDCELTAAVRGDLNELLGELNYLGRSESWIRVEVLPPGVRADFNCGPPGTVATEFRMERVQVACLRSEEEFAALSSKLVLRKRGGKAIPCEPFSWLDAIQLSTADLLKDGWSAPPAQKMVGFLRPVDALKPHSGRSAACHVSEFRVARFALHSTVLPRVTETVAIAERIRVKLMGIHRRIAGGDPAAVSAVFAGKASDGGPARGHGHVFVLPSDEDRDGRIDHVTVLVSDAFNGSELEALDGLRSIWQPNGRPDVTLVLVSLSAHLRDAQTTRWASATPFVTARHHRKGRGSYVDWLAGEVRKECTFHGLPSPASIEWTECPQTVGHEIRWMEFLRSRKGNRPLRGHGCVLTFDGPVQGPFAIGALCHFGLGLFVPMDEPTGAS